MHAFCRRQTKSLWVGEGFDLCISAKCILTGPMFWVAGMLLPVSGNRDLRQGSFSMEGEEGSSGMGKYYAGSVSVGACDDSYQRRWLARRAAAMN